MKRNRYNRLFSEFLHHPFVLMEAARFNAAYQLVMNNIRSSVEIDFSDKVLSKIISSDGRTFECFSLDDVKNSIMQSRVESSEDGTTDVNTNNSFINCVCIQGPMTREGDACTYGSKDHKAMMMEAADDGNCRGHILYINSGGGASGTLADYRDAINYCLSKGQNVVAVVEECAASAACFTACMTNRIFATRESDELGSLGMYAFFPTIADGTVDPMTNEVIHIRYADQSVDKNLAFRKAAEGDMSDIDQWLHDSLAQVLDNTRQDRPSILSSQLTGKMYKACDVMDSMVDEIGDIAKACDWLMNDYNSRNGAAISIKPEAQCNPDKKKEGDPADDNNKSQKPMITYTAIPNAIGESSMETLDGELTLQPAQADALEQYLSSEANRIAELQSQIDSLTQSHAEEVARINAEHQAAVDALNTEHQSAIEQNNESHAEEIARINAEHQAAVDALNTEHQSAVEQANATLADAQSQLDAANVAAAESQQRISDLTAEVETLNNAQGNLNRSGDQPKSNGIQPVTTTTLATGCNYSPEMSAKEYAEMKRKQNNK